MSSTGVQGFHSHLFEQSAGRAEPVLERYQGVVVETLRFFDDLLDAHRPSERALPVGDAAGAGSGTAAAAAPRGHGRAFPAPRTFDLVRGRMMSMWKESIQNMEGFESVFVGAWTMLGSLTTGSLEGAFVRGGATQALFVGTVPLDYPITMRIYE